MTRYPIEKLRCAALTAFGERHRALYGVPPEGLHTWTDAGAILLVARAQAASEPAPGRSLAASLAELQRAVVSDVYLRTGELLHPGGCSANSERGLLVLAFERVRASELVAAAVAAAWPSAGGPSP